jgi:hypothetical protein
MTVNKGQIEKFFQAYADRFKPALVEPPQVDVDGTVASFAECFVEASPVGIICGQNDDSFRKQIPKGLAFYRSIGTKAMLIDALEITPLDDFHWMAKIHWKAHYQKSGTNDPEKTIEFNVIYFVQAVEDTPKIFAYIAGDEQKVMQEHGLIPDEATA